MDPARDESPYTGRITAFRFNELPPELREAVLEFTDLVAPYDLHYTHTGLKTAIERSSRRCLHGDDADICLICERSPRNVRACNCWKIPVALFCVSYSFRLEATRVFYSRNHFVLCQTGHKAGKGYDSGYESDEEDGVAVTASTQRYTFNTIITHLDPFGLKYIRSIEFRIVNNLDDFLYDVSHDDYQSTHETDWKGLATSIRNQFNYKKLQITIDNQDCSFEQTAFSVFFLKHMRLQGFAQMVEAFKALKGDPRTFHVYVSKDLLSDRLVVPFLINKEEPRDHLGYERSLEKAVMGEDYDSAKDGKVGLNDEGKYRDHTKRRCSTEAICEAHGRMKFENFGDYDESD